MGLLTVCQQESERMKRTNAARFAVAVLSIAVSLTWTGCQPVVQGFENQNGRAEVQQVASPESVPLKRAENLVTARLLMADAVQKDLGLTAEQLGKVMDFMKFSRQQLRELAANWPELSASGNSAKVSEARKRELQAWLLEIANKQKALIAEIVAMLTPIQRERLRQIQLQQELAIALAEPELIKALDISEDQLAKIRELSVLSEEERLAEVRELDGLTPKERQTKMVEKSKVRDKKQAAANRRALDTLAPEQRATLEKFMGKKIEVSWNYDALMQSD